MTDTARLSFDVSATGSDLRLQVILDDALIWDGRPGAEIETVCYDFDDKAEQQHLLEFVMSGKRPEHTLLDTAGTIQTDRCICITNMAFDAIQLGHLFTEVTEYCHDHNGTTDMVTEPFYGIMGCNGRAKMHFATPIYLWLLENM